MSAPPGRDRVSSRQLDGEPRRAQLSNPKAPHPRNGRRALFTSGWVRSKISANPEAAQCLKLR
jgi:hypothetical protein